MVSVASFNPFRFVTAFFDAIGPTSYPEADRHDRFNGAIVSSLCLAVATATLFIALGHGAGRRGQPQADLLFWSGVFLLVVPLACRISLPNVARSERIFLVFLLGEGLYVYIRLFTPATFVNYDDYLHWITAYDILHRHKLFLENTLLPVSPYYPALEIFTTALANLAGTDVLAAASIVIALTRGLFVVLLFLFIERVSGSSRIAGMATLLYMSSSTFVAFHASFSYESMAVALVLFIFWWEARINTMTAGLHFSLVVPAVAVLALLALTHHASSRLCVVYLIAVLLAEILRRGFNPGLVIGGSIAVVGLVVVYLWEAMPFNPADHYLSAAFSHQFDALLTVLNGHSEAHVPFQSAGGRTQPMWVRMLGLCSMLLISLCLATGFFRALTWRCAGEGWARLRVLLHGQWFESRAMLLAIGAFGFPISVVFRLSNGWEVGDRMNTWAFISVGFVVAIAIVYYWESLYWWTRYCTSAVASAIVLGGIVIASGSNPIRGPFLVNADASSIEYMGIETAKWTKGWLGSGNSFAADRVNQLLLATYGDQNVVTNIPTQVTPGVDVSYAFRDRAIDRYVLAAIKRGRIDYLYMDLRNTTDLPVLGAFFQIGESGGNRPLRLTSLLKYDKRNDVGRIYDNGAIVIYNVTRLQNVKADE